MVLMILSLIWLWQQWPDGRLHIVFCDVGQGDAALVVWGSFQALVDTGPNEDKLSACLGKEMPFWDRQIELVFISHPQKDHNGVLDILKERYNLTKVVERASESDVYRYKDLYFDVVTNNDDDLKNAQKNESEENEYSIVVYLKYFDFSVLFTADIGEETELALLEQGVLKKTTVLKVPHHGSKNSSTLTFLEKLRPSWAVVSVGAGNSYGHPSVDSLMRLDQVGAKVLRTDTNGTVEVVTDGERLSVYSER